MENLIFQKSLNETGQIVGLEIGGLLVLDNSQQLKIELVNASALLSSQLKILISNPEEIDVSCIQLLVGFTKYMDENRINYQFEWNLDEDQKSLLKNVGLSNELYLNN